MAISDWSQPLSALFKTPHNKTLDRLLDAGLSFIEDLLWIFPSKIEMIPSVSPFSDICEGVLFQGSAKILAVNSRKNFYAKGKRGIPLTNIQLTIQDNLSKEVCTLYWFNTYPSFIKKFDKLDSLFFIGTPSSYKNEISIINPDLLNEPAKKNETLVLYPTVNHISGNQIQKILKRIPPKMWDSIPAKVPYPTNLPTSRSESFKTLHGKPTSISIPQAKENLAYEEFFCDQIKIQLRRNITKNRMAPFITTPPDIFNSLFSYKLTDDQVRSINEIYDDFQSGHPMMRLLQGDVGCGKTTVALIAALQAIQSGFQVAFMCPTESLALQHYQEFLHLLQDKAISIHLLVGSTKPKEKKLIQENLRQGKCNLVVGTHSLIQDRIQFGNLGLVIIDEQHKFGVNQRLKLTSKQEGAHCLIMSATPIPRSLSLTNYGDLDLSIIKTYPVGRRTIQTRIVPPDNFEKFLSFLKTRISLGEQAYVVTPAILESDDHDIMNLEKVYSQFLRYFPSTNVSFLHGQIASEQKQDTFLSFARGEIDILVSTSVIEVGINVHNATVMAILNPERFGLSSLHQLRGRVGRGSKPGFCFLISGNSLSDQGHARLKVIESTTDGFFIAEQDLQFRGEGELFGVTQSGSQVKHRIANIHNHFMQLKQARNEAISAMVTPCELTANLIRTYQNKEQIMSTI